MTSKTRRRLIAAAQLSRYRLRFGVGEFTSPRQAAHDAVRLWLTPPPPRTGDLPPVPGGTETTIETDGDGSVQSISWGAGPPIYFMHGWGGNGRQIQRLVTPLVRRGLRVVTFDAPGHGNNHRRPTHAGEFGAALAAVAQHHGRPHGIVAHSLGAVAVTRAAVDHGLPVDRLVLLAPLTAARTTLDGFAELLHIGRRTRTLLPAELHHQTGLTLDQFGCHELASVADGQSTLIVHDPSDGFTSFADSAALAKGWRNATHSPVAGLGHYRLLHDPHVISMTVQTLTRTCAVNGLVGFG